MKGVGFRVVEGLGCRVECLGVTVGVKGSRV